MLSTTHGRQKNHARPLAAVKCLFADYPLLMRGALTKQALYGELKRKSAAKHLAYKRYLDELRFNAFSQLFYDQMRVDVEFSRRFIYSCLR